MPVGVGLGDELGGDGAVGAGLVLDHRGLAEELLELRADGAADDVGGAACDEGNDYADRLRWKTLCTRGKGREHKAK